MQISRDVKTMRQALPAGKRLSTGLQVFWSDAQSSDELAEQTAEAMAAGSDGIHFYNWGLVPQSRLAWVRQAVTRVTQAVTTDP